MKSKPYHIGISKSGTDFEVHRHPEIELNYCHSGGGYTVVIDGTPYQMEAGKLAVTSSMVRHEYIRTDHVARHMSVTVVVGPALLNELFAPFSNTVLKEPVLDLNNGEYGNIKALFEEIINNKSVSPDYDGLVERGIVYRLCAELLRYVIEPYSVKESPAALLNVTKIETALEYINSHYNRQVTVSDVASVCGYSESNFCKHFKKITGISFHSALNKKRVETACMILKNTSHPLEEIATEVGFADSKSLCRVFKREMNITPNKYRKEDKLCQR